MSSEEEKEYDFTLDEYDLENLKFSWDQITVMKDFEELGLDLMMRYRVSNLY